jgi:D-amino-acid oxidase
VTLGSPISVIGAGISGLTTAICLSEFGYLVRVYARDLPCDTTSANSGAIWGPFLSTIDDRLSRWSYETLAVFKSHARVPGSGVDICRGLGVEGIDHGSRWWVESFQASTPCDSEHLPPGYERGWFYEVPIIDMPRYLEFLVGMLKVRGGHIEQVPMLEADDLASHDGHVVVCAGLGAADLVGDYDLVPSKGQLVVLENPGITEFFAERGDGPELTYILPQGPQIILGGTAEGNFESEEADPRTSIDIIERCANLEPRLLDARVLGTRVGIRPCRATVRLCHSDPPYHQVFNYGHGGSGVSVAWGCANAVAQVIQMCEGA